MTNEWISVTENVPTMCRPVLTWNSARNSFALAFRSNGGWVTEHIDPMHRVSIIVTHWQPLPAPPPKPDPFEKYYKDVLAPQLIAAPCELFYDRARMIWDAAIASQKPSNAV